MNGNWRNAPADSARPQRMLGLLPPKNAPALRLALTGTVPAHPTAADHLSAVPAWGLYGNDRYGVCGPTSVANYIRLVTRYLTGAELDVTQDDVFDLYRRSGNPNFDPADPGGPGDGGVDMQTMLEALTAGGIGGGHRPLAFAKLNHDDPAELQAAISIFGGVLLGVVLQDAQQTQTDNHGPWDYVPSGQWGGHAVLAGAYTGHTYGGDVAVVTWAQVIGCTDSFIGHQVQEAWVVIMPEHLDHPGFQEGVNLAALSADYTALTGRPFPQPTPGPTPTPTPPPPPAPGPPAGPAPADLALVKAVGPWAALQHHGTTATVAHAIRDWRAARGL